jgi:hypothetical protein
MSTIVENEGYFRFPVDITYIVLSYLPFADLCMTYYLGMIPHPAALNEVRHRIRMTLSRAPDILADEVDQEQRYLIQLCLLYRAIYSRSRMYPTTKVPDRIQEAYVTDLALTLLPESYNPTWITIALLHSVHPSRDLIATIQCSRAIDDLHHRCGSCYLAGYLARIMNLDSTHKSRETFLVYIHTADRIATPINYTSYHDYINDPVQRSTNNPSEIIDGRIVPFLLRHYHLYKSQRYPIMGMLLT